MAVFDDRDPSEKLRIYDRGVGGERLSVVKTLQEADRLLQARNDGEAFGEITARPRTPECVGYNCNRQFDRRAVT